MMELQPYIDPFHKERNFLRHMAGASRKQERANRKGEYKCPKCGKTFRSSYLRPRCPECDYGLPHRVKRAVATD